MTDEQLKLFKYSIQLEVVLLFTTETYNGMFDFVDCFGWLYRGKETFVNAP